MLEFNLNMRYKEVQSSVTLRGDQGFGLVTGVTHLYDLHFKELTGSLKSMSVIKGKLGSQLRILGEACGDRRSLPRNLLSFRNPS